jgi:hypothetical protein
MVQWNYVAASSNFCEYGPKNDPNFDRLKLKLKLKLKKNDPNFDRPKMTQILALALALALARG